MAGSITYARAITGTLNGINYSYNDTSKIVCNNGWVNDYSIAATTWTTIISGTYSGNEWTIAIINKGANSCIYRIKVGSNYWRFKLPAGKSVRMVGNGAYGGVSNGIDLAVYSASGTDIQVGYFY